jgi:hypothetical protein
MGVIEACARDQVATALEQAMEAGRLWPTTQGFRLRRAEIRDGAPLDGGDGGSRVEAVHAERLEIRLNGE